MNAIASCPSALPMLAFEQVSLHAGGRPLLQGLTLHVPARGLLGIVGPNGAGKTTLLRAALGLLAPQAGRVLIEGRAPQDWPPRALAARLGYVPQHAHSHWDLRVSDMLHLHPGARPAVWIERFALGPLLGRRFASLSGGERARVAAARALAHEPALLLADEPAAHLDIPQHHRFMALLRQVASERAVVVVLHDLHVAARHCDRLALLGGGGLLAHGRPDEALTPELLAVAYGAPLARHAVDGQLFFTRPSGEDA